MISNFTFFTGPSNIGFVLKGVTRTINASWSVDVTGAELEYKTKLRKGDYKTLNLYFLTKLRGDALGVDIPNYVQDPTDIKFSIVRILSSTW
jgi:hypothetical protein